MLKVERHKNFVHTFLNNVAKTNQKTLSHRHIENGTNMTADHDNFRRPQEECNSLVLLSTWNDLSLRRKKSKKGLLDDLDDIDPVIQKHMTISTRDWEAMKEIPHVLLQRQFHPQKLDDTKRYIAAQKIRVDVHRIGKYRRSKCQDKHSGVTKLRLLNFHKSKKIPLLDSNGGNYDNDTQLTFWRHLNALTGSIHGTHSNPMY
jgi:hypothetical protein